MIIRITLSNHNLSFKENLLRLIGLFFLNKNVSNLKKTLGNMIVCTLPQYFFCDIQLLICGLLCIYQRLFVPLCEVLNMCFLNHRLAVSNIKDLMFIESSCHCNICCCFKTFHSLSDFKSKHVYLRELKVDFAYLIVRKH